jgi:hypothetical protein
MKHLKEKRKMKRILFTCSAIILVTMFSSCGNTSKTTDYTAQAGENSILQEKDGTISLKVEKAALYHDEVNPASNTAEWSVVVSKSGRFNVWLSSATKDTTDLRYKNSVMLSIRENRIEKHPECDKIVQNSTDVSYPYFRADSFMGSLYIQDTGLYNIQVISEKILPKDYNSTAAKAEDNSKLISVFLTPVTR